MIRRHFLLAAATAAYGATALTATAKARSPGSWIPTASQADSLEPLMSVAGVPGMAIGVLERGRLAWQRQLGVADAVSRVKVDADTLFEAASTSKPVFAYAVLRLVDRGVLDLDRALANYLRPPYLPADARLDRITARHVLTHSSGLPNWSQESNAETFLPAFEPGTRYRYSGEGFFWLQLVAEKLTGKGLDALMRELVFEPAGMTRSRFVLDAESLSNLAAGHISGRRAPQQGLRDIVGLVSPLAKTWGKPVREWAHEDWLRSAAALDPGRPTQRVRFQNAAASLFTTVADYARFLGGILDPSGSTPWRISEELRRAMLSPLLAVQPGLPLWRGLGWSIERCGNDLRFGHEGNNDGRFTAYVGAEVRGARGLIVFANDGAGFGLYQYIARALTDGDQLSFMANADPVVR
jgi:CubicO group peptidase (beta-lactamase class C family)